MHRRHYRDRRSDPEGFPPEGAHCGHGFGGRHPRWRHHHPPWGHPPWGPWRRYRRPRRIFWRFYLFGLLLLAVVALTVGIFSRLLSAPASSMYAPERLAAFVDAELTPLLDDPVALAAKLARVRDAFDVDIAVYRHDGSLVARAGEAHPLDHPPDRPTTQWRGGALDAAAPIDGGRAYVVARHLWHGGTIRWLLMPLIVLGVI